MERTEMIREMHEMLLYYNHDEATEAACTRIYDEWAARKANLIAHLRTVDGWDEEHLMVRRKIEVERALDADVVYNFRGWLQRKIVAEADPTYVDKIPTWGNGYFISTKDNTNEFLTWLEHGASRLEEQCTFFGITLGKGLKMSRAVRRICDATGWSKYESFEHEFAQYADAVAGGKQTLVYCISANPLDYLTMSFGHSWSSCHTIDFQNIRQSEGTHYEGMYRAGTLSYMLDSTTLISYTILPEWECEQNFDGFDKISRINLHMNADTCIVARAYPQSTTAGADIYGVVQGIVHEMWEKMYGVLLEPWHEVYSFGVSPVGPHYRDYLTFRECRQASRTTLDTERVKIDIGAPALCVKCGEKFYEHNTLYCGPCDPNQERCERCGCSIGNPGDDDFDGYYIDGYGYVCSDCGFICDRCDEVALWDDHVEVHNGGRYTQNWCSSCAENHSLTCDVCGNAFDEDYVTYIDGDEIYVCENEATEACDKCGLTFLADHLHTIQDVLTARNQRVCNDCNH